jgi:hypothetical protein
LFTSTVLLFFFVALAAAGMRDWTADSRDVEYGLWPLAPCPGRIAVPHVAGRVECPTSDRSQAASRRDMYKATTNRSTAADGRCAFTHLPSGRA